MHQNSSHSSRRIKQYITYGLTVIGLALFLFGGSRAISQSNERRYVEGQQREQQIQTARLANARTQDNPEQNGLTTIVRQQTQSKSDQPAVQNWSNENTSKDDKQTKHHGGRSTEAPR